MEKAYDLKYLAEKLKAVGLEATEETAKSAVSELLDFLKESAALSATPFDNILIPIYDMAKPLIMAELDKINPNG